MNYCYSAAIVQHPTICKPIIRVKNYHTTDEKGKDSLSIAKKVANAVIVMLLHLARMNEEMWESEGLHGQLGDKTYHNIFHESSQMVSNNPKKLKHLHGQWGKKSKNQYCSSPNRQSFNSPLPLPFCTYNG